jgi:hypothetical protein
MPVRGVPFTQSPGQQWQIQPANDGNALIVSRIGRVALDIPQRSRADGARVQTYPVNGDPNQRFMFRLISKPTASPEQVRERYRNRAEDQAHSGFYDERDHTWKMEGDGVCFYRGPNYTSKAFCVRLGENVPNVPQDWLEVFRSVKFFGNVRAVVAYRDPGFAGRRVRIVHDEPDLELYRSEQGDVFERQVRSLRLF